MVYDGPLGAVFTEAGSGPWSGWLWSGGAWPGAFWSGGAWSCAPATAALTVGMSETCPLRQTESTVLYLRALLI